MDPLLSILLIVVIYVAPQLLKLYRSSIENSLDRSKPLTTEGTGTTPKKIHASKYIPKSTQAQPKIVTPKVQSTPTIIEEASAWNGKLDQNAIINGVTFAEILLPPRAYRPFTRR